MFANNMIAVYYVRMYIQSTTVCMSVMSDVSSIGICNIIAVELFNTL